MLAYDFRYDVVAIIICLATLFGFFRSKTISTYITGTFRDYVLLVLVSSYLDILTVIIPVYMPNTPEWILYAVNMGYLILFNSVSFTFFLFIVCISDRNKKFNKKFVWLSSIPLIVLTILVLTTGVTKFVFYFEDNNIYVHGQFYPFLVASSWLYIVLSFYKFFTNYKEFTPSQGRVFIFYTLYGLFASVYQYLKPQSLIMGFVLSLAGLLIYLTFENPAEYIDKPTNLLNRRAFKLVIGQALENKKELSIVGIYIPELRFLNDTIGAHNKHIIQRQIVSYLKKFIDKKNIYRISHSKMAVIVSNETRLQTEQIGRIKTCFVESFKSGNIEISLSAMLDFVSCPSDAVVVEEVLDLIENSFSDVTTLEEKGIITANTDILEKTNRERKIIQILGTALAEEDFDVVYQPIYSIKEKRFTTAEALLRLNNTELGYISPDEFIPIAEKNGLILKIGNFVLKNVCRFLAENRIWENGIEYVHVNLSALQCMQASLYEQLFEIMDSYKLSYNLVNLEVTETTAIASSETLMENMDKMKRREIRFSLDDYGTGFSNTSTLVKYPFNTIKLDKSMIWSAFQDEKAKIILKETISMIKELNMEVVAEGVETESQVELLKELECDYIQGYYYSIPLSETKLLQFIEENKYAK